jgi:hypothetical protein
MLSSQSLLLQYLNPGDSISREAIFYILNPDSISAKRYSPFQMRSMSHPEPGDPSIIPSHIIPSHLNNTKFWGKVSGLHFSLLREETFLKMLTFRMNPTTHYPKPVRADYNLPLQKIIRPKGVHNGHIRTQVSE